MNDMIYNRAVLGAGESGVGAALLYQAKGYKVFVSDYGTIAPNYKRELEEAGIAYEEGQHSREILLQVAEVVKSPGIPDTAPIVKALAEEGIPIISEIELAGRYCKAKVVGITGSNGKTTTTMWLHHILQEADIRASLSGNVGFSLARQVISEDQPEWFVLELSSFQLDGMYRFHLDIAILMNITPDHLDRYDYQFEKYALSKMRVLQNQGKQDSFIYWGEDEFISRYVLTHTPLPMKLLPFTTYPQVGTAADRSDEHMMRVHFSDKYFEMPITELALPGPHNLQNAMAASIAALEIGVSTEVLRKALSDFTNVPHRLEHIAVIDGVSYVNDSKATNTNSTYYALRTMTSPYVLILGGTDKGNDYTDLSELVAKGARGLVFLARDKGKLHQSFDGRVSAIAEANSMEEAIAAARSMAHRGDTVLLSPACASFDLFKNYKHRGDEFRRVVLTLKEERDR